MLSRRTFIEKATLAGMAVSVPGAGSFVINDDEPFSYESSFIRIRLPRDRPEFSFFSTDSLGGGQLALSPLLEKGPQSAGAYESRVMFRRIHYFKKGMEHRRALWECKARPRSVHLRTRWTEGESADPFVMTFSQKANHCTVLGYIQEDSRVKFPCILHLPGMGTFRIYCNDPDVTLLYDARRTGKPYVSMAMPAADEKHQDITYTFESVAIYPQIDQIKNDTRFDGYRRNFINMFQLSPGFKALANNATSDACAFTLFIYTEMARATPRLAEGLTAMDLIRNTLDRYLQGMLGYGMVGKVNWQSEYNSSDSMPSLVMSACYYILETRDRQWAEKNYDGIKAWASKMIATDKNGDGIVEYGYSGNSNSWNGKFKRPANWWDTIGFGHDDAYSNALAYRACVLLSKVAAELEKKDDNHFFEAFADKLRRNYYVAFYNRDTGVLGGWRSKDGVLHDYYFTFVNSVAVCYGLIEEEDARKMMRCLLEKMKEVGYTNFRLGMPGNLIPVAGKDYTHHDKRWGYQNFQAYENGGATGCYVYYTIRALYMLGMRKEADEILMAMLESYKNNSFDGNCPGSSMTKDWKTWQGKCWGYEGFLVDNYLALLNVLDHFGLTDTKT